MKPLLSSARTAALRLALTAFAWAGASGVRAQPFEAPPPPGPPPRVTIAPPFERSLPNGLRVIVAERSGLPLVTVSLMVGTGSEADPAALGGVNALTNELLVMGTGRRSAPQIAAAAEALGGSLATSAGWHGASVGITITRPMLAPALALLAEVVRTPTFAQAELDRARHQALDGLRVALADPGQLAGMAAARAVFGDGAYGHLRSGTAATLARIGRADLVRAHAAAYRPDNAVLIFAGAITPAQALALARDTFGDWTRPAAPVATPATVPVGSGSASTIAIDLPDAGQAGVVVGAASIPRGAPDWTAGQVANAVLGHGYSSRLNQEIRVKRGLSYGASSRLDARRAGGMFVAATQTKNASAAEVVGIIQGEIGRMGVSPPAPEELVARKATLIGDFSRSLETTAGLAGNLAALVAGGVPLDTLGRYIDDVGNVTPAQVQAFASVHWRVADMRTVVVGDARQFEAALRGIDARLRTIGKDALDLDRADLAKSVR